MSGVDDSYSKDAISTPRLVLIVGLATAAVVLLGIGLVHAHLEWPLGEVYVRLMVGAGLLNLACVALLNPKLIGRRAFPGPGTKRWDVVVMALLVPAMLAVFVVAGLDGSDWTSDSPGATWWSGLVLFVLGWILIIWSMVVNPFFEKTVRIQTDNDHRVVDTGPYAYVRHPGYVGFLLWLLSTPLLLASSLAFIPAACATTVFVIRVVLEDRMLQRELPGYLEYAGRTRFRLIPGVW